MENYRAADLNDDQEPPPMAPGWWNREDGLLLPPRVLPTVNASSFAGKAVPTRLWHVEGMIPAGTVTMFGGNGGVGKSLTAKQLGVSTVLGRPWFGRTVRQGPCLFLSAEDDMDEVHRRLADITADEHVGFEDLVGLTLSSLAGEDAVLAAPEGRTNLIRPTKLFEALESRAQECGAVLIILDTLSDLFGGDENQRTQARQFIGLLRGLALHSGAAVLLLSHPSLAGMSSGSGLSGSTSWNNSVRSRLYLDRVIGPDGTEDDPDARVLKVLKANYGTTDLEIKLRWRRGVFTSESKAGSSFANVAAHVKADRVFLELLGAYVRDGRNVNANPSPSFAPTVFARDPKAEGLGKRALNDAMNRLFTAGVIQVVEFGSPSHRRSRIELVSKDDGK